jgi:hypothetical protein
METEKDNLLMFLVFVLLEASNLIVVVISAFILVPNLIIYTDCGIMTLLQP